MQAENGREPLFYRIASCWQNKTCLHFLGSFYHDESYESRNIHQGSGNASDTGNSFRSPGYVSDTGSESTDSLLEEAREYLKVAKTRLVTIEDWSKIQEEKLQRKKLKKRVRHSPNAVSFCKQPLVNFINILQKAFGPIFLAPKNYKAKL